MPSPKGEGFTDPKIGTLKIGKDVLYPLEELDRWDCRNILVCRPFRSLPNGILME
jgi:hypothetical protein